MRNEDNSSILNSQTESGHNAVTRLTSTRDNQDQPSQDDDQYEPHHGAKNQGPSLNTNETDAQCDEPEKARPCKRPKKSENESIASRSSGLPQDPDPDDPGGILPGTSRTPGSAVQSKARHVTVLKRKRM